MRKAQASVEYLSIIALSLLILVPVWLFVNNINTDVQGELNLGYAKQAVRHIGESADLVFSQGYPAQLLVEVRVPSNIESVSIQANELSVRVSKKEGLSDVFYVTNGNLTGDLDDVFRTPGVKRVLVKAVPFADYTVVNLTQAN
ncbi:hypothetical protein HUU53_01125 [Candidatus Micrarchaeota archaeon]|nr:hypothetical protein [Candidatus Micrarchaeota archaeon]